jgi:DNA-binding transcriptional MerR regulator
MSVTYKIGEAASLLRLKTYVLRFWETEFPQIAPLRTEKGQRLYTEEHLALLDRIRFLLHEHGLTIEGARKVLSEEASRGVRYTRPAPPHNRPAPASAGVRSTPGISVSGHKGEPALAGRSGGSLPLSRFSALSAHADRSRRTETAIPQAPQSPSPSQAVSSREIPLRLPPSHAKTEKNLAPQAPLSPGSLPPEETGEEEIRLESSEAPFFPDEGNPEENRETERFFPNPEMAETPELREDARFWQDVVEELEAVAALLRGAPSGKNV